MSPGGFLTRHGKTTRGTISTCAKPATGSCSQAQPSRRTTVERASRLVSNPEYPSTAQLEKIALLLADHFLAANRLN